MKLYRTLFLWACLAVAGLASADELNVAELTINPGESKAVAVELRNPDHAYMLLEFTLKLPQGISITEAKLNADRAGGHTLDLEPLANGDYKFLVYSLSNATITGNSGEIMTLTLTASADAPTGPGQGLFYDQLFAGANDVGVTPADKAFNIRVGGIRGDANGDDEVTVADVTATVSYLLGRQPAGFVLSNADLDGNGQVTIEELMTIVNIVLGKEPAE